MQRPAWSTIVGILMILIGGCGSVNDLKQIKIEEVMEFQDDILKEITTELDIEQAIPQEDLESLEELAGDTISSDMDTLDTAERLIQSVKKISYMPEATIQKLKLHGYLGLPISIIVAITGVLFFTMRKHIIKLAGAVLIISILFAIYQLIDISNLEISKILKIGLNTNLSAGAFMSVILMVILVLSDKSYYNPTQEVEDYFD